MPSPRPPGPVTNLHWRTGPELGPEQMGKGERRFCSQGTVLCDGGVHAVAAGGMGRQTLLRRSSSLLLPFSTTPMNRTTWHSPAGPGEVSETLPILMQVLWFRLKRRRKVPAFTISEL